MLSITAVLGSHEFGLRIWLWAQVGSQISAGREDFASGRAVLSTLSEGLEIELSDFKAENATLKGDYLRQVVEIVIGGVPTVLEIRLMCMLMSLGRLPLQYSISTNLFDPVRHQVHLRTVGVGIWLSGIIYLVGRIIPPGIHFAPLLGWRLLSAFVSSSTFRFFTSSALRVLALAFALVPARSSKKTSSKVWKRHKTSSM